MRKSQASRRRHRENPQRAKSQNVTTPRHTNSAARVNKQRPPSPHPLQDPMRSLPHRLLTSPVLAHPRAALKGRGAAETSELGLPHPRLSRRLLLRIIGSISNHIYTRINPPREPHTRRSCGGREALQRRARGPPSTTPTPTARRSSRGARPAAHVSEFHHV